MEYSKLVQHTDKMHDWEGFYFCSMGSHKGPVMLSSCHGRLIALMQCPRFPNLRGISCQRANRCSYFLFFNIQHTQIQYGHSPICERRDKFVGLSQLAAW